MLSWGKKWKPGSSSTVTQGQGHTQQDPEPARVLAYHHTAPSETFRLANSSGLPGAPPGPWEAGGADAVTSRGLLTGWQQACGLRSCSSFCAHGIRRFPSPVGHSLWLFQLSLRFVLRGSWSQESRWGKGKKGVSARAEALVTRLLAASEA